jgi:hypothetical protein
MSDIDDLMNELKDTKNFGVFAHTNKAPVSAAEFKPIAENDINQYIIDSSAKIIQQGLETINDIKDNVSNGASPDELMAYSDLIKAVTSSIDTLNKINIQNKKGKTAIEIKEMEISNKKLSPTGNVTNNTLIVAPREELMKMLKDADKNDTTINITPVEESDSNESLSE